MVSWTDIDYQLSQEAYSSEPTVDLVGEVVDAANSAIDWWKDDPLNGPAEEVFDGLNTAVETAGSGSEMMNDVAIETACHPVGNVFLGAAGGAVAGDLVASACYCND